VFALELYQAKVQAAGVEQKQSMTRSEVNKKSR